jgi:hypothetical protein
VDSETNQIVVPLAKSGMNVYNLTTASSNPSTSSTSSSTAPVHTNAAGRWASSIPLMVGALVLVIPFVGY